MRPSSRSSGTSCRTPSRQPRNSRARSVTSVSCFGPSTRAVVSSNSEPDRATSSPPVRRVVLTSGTAAKARERFQPLSAAALKVVERFDLASVSDPRSLADELAGAWAVVADSANRFDDGMLSRLPNLRVIARTGVGYDAIDVAAAAGRGVVVFTTPGTLTESVADYAVALMLAALRDVPGADAAVRSGVWRAPRIGRDLSGATVAVVGFGAIGRAVARRLLGFDCRIIAVDPHISDDAGAQLGVTRLSLGEALPLADVVTLHVALTPETRGLVGRRE